MICYLGGPMRGLDLYNFPAFFQAAQALRSEGHTVVNPAEVDMAKGFNPAEPLDSETNAKVFCINTALRADFRIIVNGETDSIVFLPGWRESAGATAEAVVAYYSGVKIYGLVWVGPPGGSFYVDEITDAPTVTFDKKETYVG